MSSSTSTTSVSILQRFPLLSLPLPLVASSCSLLSIPTLLFTLSPFISGPASPQWRRMKRALKLRVKAMLIELTKTIQSLEKRIYIENGEDEQSERNELPRDAMVKVIFLPEKSKENRRSSEHSNESMPQPSHTNLSTNETEPESPLKVKQTETLKEGEIVSLPSPMTDRLLSSSLTDSAAYSVSTPATTRPPSSDSSSTSSPLLSGSLGKCLMLSSASILSNSSPCSIASGSSASVHQSSGLSFSSVSHLFIQFRSVCRQRLFLTFVVSHLYSTLQEIRQRDPFVDVIIKEHFQKHFAPQHQQPAQQHRKRSISSEPIDEKEIEALQDSAIVQDKHLQLLAAKTEEFFLSNAFKGGRMKAEHRRGGRRRMRSIDENDEANVATNDILDSAPPSRRPSESDNMSRRGSTDATHQQF